MGGMLFTYFNGDDTLYMEDRLDLFLYGFIVLKDFPFTLIPREEREQSDYPRPTLIKQNRLKFGNLTPTQTNQLRLFLKHYTIRP